MESWWTRLLGGTTNRSTSRKIAHDPDLRLAKFKRLYHAILGLCNRPRELSSEGPLLEQLHGYLEKIAFCLREETRAPAPHLSLQFAASNRIYTVITRAASASQNEPVIQATIAVLAALVDSEEEDFLSNAVFAKSLMRLIMRVLHGSIMLINLQTETSILELLFTITARIRLQPHILPFWFHPTSGAELEDVFVSDKQSFVGAAQKDNFPLCYLLIDRVHHDGRVGDFARTGLLYIFEATGKSTALEAWIVSSDIPTLMSSGLGALYSQLSRELSILHPDATLPAVLAMSDYSTTHPRATAESAFSERHQRHMATFLSYLSFWQDVLDHTKSTDVRQTLLDHFQILFLQQLLYPSLLQSSDTDAGSSVAVLTYLTATIQSLDYQDLMEMMLKYLLAIEGESSALLQTTTNPTEPPRSPTTARKRESLLLLTAPRNSEDIVEPTLFNLVDLVLNNLKSRNAQSVYAALRLFAIILTRQEPFALGTFLKVLKADGDPKRTIGALDVEVEMYSGLATILHDHDGLNDAFDSLIEDTRIAIETQVSLTSPEQTSSNEGPNSIADSYILVTDGHTLKALETLLRSFFTNGVDVNLALSQTFISIAQCLACRLDSWLALDPSRYVFENASLSDEKPWVAALDEEESAALAGLHRSSERPKRLDHDEPMLYATLKQIVAELDEVRLTIPNLDYLISVRKAMIRAIDSDSPPVLTDSPSSVHSPPRPSPLDVQNPTNGTTSPIPGQIPSLAGVRGKANNIAGSDTGSLATSAEPNNSGKDYPAQEPGTSSIFLPPPPQAPYTTDVLMQTMTFPNIHDNTEPDSVTHERQATLNHVLTNVVILQEFVLELVAVLQIRAAVLGEQEVSFG